MLQGEPEGNLKVPRLGSRLIDRNTERHYPDPAEQFGVLYSRLIAVV